MNDKKEKGLGRGRGRSSGPLNPVNDKKKPRLLNALEQEDYGSRFPEPLPTWAALCGPSGTLPSGGDRPARR